MSKIAVIEPEKSYTFAEYFKLNCEPDDLLAYFGYWVRGQITNVAAVKSGVKSVRESETAVRTKFTIH